MPLPRQLPLAGRTVQRVGYGAMQLADHGGGLAVTPDQAITVLHALLEYGRTVIDTAEFYGDGALNDLLGVALAGRHDDVVLATKVGAVTDPATRLRPAQQPKELRAQVEANLASLRVDRLDLVFIRRADFQPGIIATGDQVVPLDDQLAELGELRDEGKIATIGLSNIIAAQLESALGADVAAVQNIHNVIDRDGEDVLALCRRHGIAWMPYCPLGGNFPGREKVTEVPGVLAAAAELDITPTQLGLAWLLHAYERTVLIPGTRSLGHLAENMASVDIALPPEILTRLAAIRPSSRQSPTW